MVKCRQVSNAIGSVVSEEALVEVEALDILSIIEHFVEDRQITFRTLFMQYNRSTVRCSGPRKLQSAPYARMHWTGRYASRARG
jgi:hypothetical protein